MVLSRRTTRRSRRCFDAASVGAVFALRAANGRSRYNSLQFKRSKRSKNPCIRSVTETKWISFQWEAFSHLIAAEEIGVMGKRL
jgi:hypothetical protein